MTPVQRKAAAIAAASLIAMPMEGLRQYAYSDPVGILTVCYGSTSVVEKGRFYTLDECKARLDADMAHAIDLVERCVPGLPVPVLAAFGDATYNMGSTIACDLKRSSAARKLKAGDLAGACNELPKWNKARVAGVPVELPGLTKRRAKERDLCLTGAA